jgi:hypothetical protein
LVQALDALVHAVGGGQDQHRQGGAARAQLAQHLEAVQARQAEVQDQQVELVRGEGGVGLGAAGDLVDGVAGAAQRAQQAVGQDLVVFGDEDAHARGLRGGSAGLRAVWRGGIFGPPPRLILILVVPVRWLTH